MAKQIINVGLTPNDRRGDPVRIAFQKSNDNFTELYTNVATISNEVSTLSNVAFSGSYTDLLNIPPGGTGTQGDIGFTGSIGATGFAGSVGFTGSIGAIGTQGNVGFTGSIGGIGFVGSQGIQGIQGIVGYAGSRGFNGSQGIQGITGNTGFAGSQGSQGIQGIQGITGNIGFTGSQGIRGITGITGFTGSQGIIGTTGFTGSQGIQGITGNIGFAGSQGVRGITGFTGSQGIQGITGNIGFTGSQGIQGVIGTTGFTGSQGVRGITGFTGSRGVIGTTGFTGSQGIEGIIGTTGFTGSQGSQGIQGTTGFIGSRGIQGTTGFAGSQGIIGTTGFTGSQGSQGIQGTTGFIGSFGFTGSQGEIGFTGSQGDTGFVGSQGSIGVKGDKGDTGSQGVSVTLQGTKATIADLPTAPLDPSTFSGHGWIVTTGDGNTHLDGSLWFWDLTNSVWDDIGPIVGPQGDQGATGSQGDTGFAGSRGDTGFTGSQGDIGFAGSQGDMGFAGSRGDFGFTGSAGDIGFTGSQGDVGFTGSLGETGSQGDNGFTGSAGDVGFTGSNGDTGFTGSAGDTGFTGSVGDTGFTGSQGDIGFTGSQGDNGFTGSAGLGFTPLVGGQNWNTDGSLIGTNVYWYVPSPPDNGAFAVGNYILLSDTTSGSTYYYYARISLIQFAGGFGLAVHADILGGGGTPVGGTSSSWITELTGERGPQGYTGSHGDVGFTGSQGDTGFTGSNGDVGFTGSQGDTGFTGSTGPAGADALWNFTGAYGGGASYAVGDVATYSGETWYRTNANGGNTGDTPAEGIFWTKIAQKGTDGTPGTSLTGWAVDINTHFIPNTDNLQDLGTPTNRIRHIYVGPGSITVGSSVITEATTGKLVLPGITRGINYTIDEVEEKGDQTYPFAGTPTIIDAARYYILQGVLTAPQGYQPPVYTVDQMDDGFIDGISIVNDGAGLDQTVAAKMRDQMRAYIGSDPDPINNFQAIDWVVIPFTVSTEAADIEYENAGGASNLEDLNDVQLDGPSNGQVLTWNNNQEKWENQDPAGGNVNTGDIVFNESTLESDTSGNFVNLDVNGAASMRLGTNGNDPVKVITNYNNDGGNVWDFSVDGILKLPEGGDIVDSTGTSVLGDNVDLGNFKILDGILGTQGETSNDWGSFNINIDPGGESYAYISIPSVENQNNGESLQLHSYATETSQIRLFGRGGVQIITTDNGNNQKVFEFDNRGAIRLPENGDILDSSGQSVLGGSGGLTTVSRQDTPPTADNGTLWFNTVEGRLYIKYSNAWVDAAPLMMPAPELNPEFSTITFPDNTVQTTAFTGANSTVTKNGGGVGTETAIDLTKTVNKLSDGVYTLADGVEGQVMYLVRQTGAVYNAIDVIVANARVNGTLNTNIAHLPFQAGEGFTHFDMSTLIFTDGAWQASNGGWD